jgi:hypothetical protein
MAPLRRAGLLGVLGAIVTASAAAAQPPPPPPSGATTTRAVRLADGVEVRLSNHWTRTDREGRAEVKLAVGAGAPRTLHRGPLVLSDLSVGHGRVAVTLVHPGRRPFVRVAVVPLDGSAAPEPLEVPAGQGGLAPTALVSCADPEGFTILWQEQGGNMDVRAYMGRVAADGRWLRRPAAVNVPWALAAIAHNGRGYHLGLFYDGARPTDTRLAMVTLSDAGVPEQHPWWATSPQRIDEVQLVAAEGRIEAFFRGRTGDGLSSADVTAVGQWGRDPGNERRRSELAPTEEFAVRVADGETAVVRRAADQFP